MEKNKKRKIYIAVMSVLLVLTFVATSTFTLSFFGSSGSGTSKITLGNAVTVDSSVTVSTANLYVLPSQKVVVNATATVKSEGKSTPTPALLRARIDVVTTAPSVKHTIEDSITLDSAKAYWVKAEDGYFYLMSSNSSTGTLTTISPGTTGKAVPLNITVNIPDTLTNADNGKIYKISVTFCAIQGIIYSSDGINPITNSIGNTKEIFNNVEGTSGQGEEKTLTKYEIQGNTQLSNSPSPNNPATITSVGEGGGKNLFDPSKVNAFNSSGLTINYSAEEDCFVINGKPTTTIADYSQNLNIPVDKTAKYSLSAYYVSGAIDRSTSSSTTKYAVAYFGKNDTINQYTNWQATNLENYETSIVNVACDKNYITRFWFYINDGITFNNYKVRIQLEKNSTATAYESYNSVNIEYSGSDGTNLVVNGDGRLNNNTNFTSFTYSEDSTSPTGSKFTKTSSTYLAQTTNLISVDTSAEYELSAYIKAEAGTGTNYYAGFACYDIDKNVIGATNIYHFMNSTTYLTQELKNGDTVVHLANVSGFSVASSTPTYQRGFIFWNYKDSTGYQYPISTYSRNVWDNLYDYGAINTTNNTITLKSAWTHGTFAKGTYLSQSNSGSGFTYCLQSGAKAPTTWTYKSINIQGLTHSDGSYSHFRYGTRYIKPFLMDGGSDKFSWTGVSFKRVGENYSINLAGHEPLRRVSDTVYDYIDSSTGTLTRKVGVYKFTGDESWTTRANTGAGIGYISAYMSGGQFSSHTSAVMPANTLNEKFLCTHFPYLFSSSTYYVRNEIGMMGYVDDSAAFMFTIPTSIASTTAEWKAYLKAQAAAGTPVTIYYKLATPVTEKVSCPTIKISTNGSNIYNATSSGAFPILKITE